MHDIFEQFPKIEHAFAYGSGVFKQPGLYENKPEPGAGPMVDLIFAVKDPLAWHKENIERHRSHYSSGNWFGPSAIDWIAERVGAGVYFNTLVPWDSRMIKYGVVRLHTLEIDLLTWNSLYLAGRLHKPVQTLASHVAIEEAQKLNLESALRVALLLMEDESFSISQLLRVLCGLSYEGDMRMGVAEDSSKVERIVRGSFEGLTRLYAPALTVAESEWKVLQSNSSKDYFSLDSSPIARAPLLAALPASLLSKVGAAVGRPVPTSALSETATRATLATDLAEFSQCRHMLRKCLASTVRASSAKQAAAGLLSAGAVKSVRYAFRKLKKAGKNTNTIADAFNKTGLI